MNLKTDIYKAYTAIFNEESYPRDLAFETQKPRSTTYVYMDIADKNQVLKTTGGVVYNVTVTFSFYTNSEIKSKQDEIDKLTNILDQYHFYRDTTKTYFFNALTQGVVIGTDEDQFKFQITVNLTYEEVN